MGQGPPYREIDMNRIKKGDEVIVTAGKDKGKRGDVVRVMGDKVVVSNVNIIKRHTKPNPGRQIKGGVVEREAPVHASNVQIVCPTCGKPTRIGYRKDEEGRSVRVCRKCGGDV